MNTQRTGAAVLATVTALLLGACSDDSTPNTSEQPPVSEGGQSANPSTATPSSASPPSLSPSTTEGTAGYRLLGPTSRVLEPGRWAVTAAGSRDVPLAVLDLPEGLNGGAEYVWSQGVAPENDGWIFGYWSVGGAVYLDPCTRKGTFDTQQFKFPDIWVEALAAQQRTTTSPPVPVTLDGYHGIYVELTAPKNLDYGTCQEDRLTIFETTTKGDHHWIATPGVVDRYWILDVEGERIVLTGAVTPQTTDSQFEQLTEIVESVQFDRS